MNDIESIYLIGSLRNEKVPKIGKSLRDNGFDVFDDWHGAGPEADDKWKEYEEARGRTYAEALDGYAANHVFSFDKYHLNRCDASILVLPAGRSGHLELGYSVGIGKRGFILYDHTPKLKDGWSWVAGIYEGEGSITVNNTKTSKNLQLSVSSTDRDVIEKLYKTTGVGNIQGPYIRKHANLLKQPKEIKPMYRWAVYKKDDILHVCKGILPEMCGRRQAQIETIINRLGWSNDLKSATGPYEERWDVMARFAEQVFFSEEEMMEYLLA